jgi:hypothetical protein
MEHKLINTGDYLLIVNDSEIKEGDWCIDHLGKLSRYYSELKEFKKYFSKVISHLPNNSPILEGVDLLPLEDEVEKLANEYIKGYEQHPPLYTKMGFIKGYNKAKEKYKYTEEDLRKAMKYASEITNNKFHYMDKYIQSLQQLKYPVGFKCEMVCRNLGCMKMILNGENSVCCGDNMEPKTITNSEGLTQWVGEWIY